ncbi:unnamed protein product, partial [Brassica oleracea var. botrytis]
ARVSKGHSSGCTEQHKHAFHHPRQSKITHRGGGERNKELYSVSWGRNGTVHIQLWGDECDAFEAGDIVKLTNGIFSYLRNNGLLLRAGKRGKMEKAGEFTVAFVETPNVSEIQWNPDPENPKRYIQNGAVSAYSRIFPHLP